MFSKAFKTHERDGLLVVYLLQNQLRKTQNLFTMHHKGHVYLIIDMSQALSSPFVARIFGSLL